MFGWIARLICNVVITIKNFLLDNLIAMSNDMVFGKVSTW